METLVLSRNEVAKLVDIDSLKTETIEGFKHYSNGTSRRDGKRIVLNIDKENSSTVLGPGTSFGIPAYTIKTNSKFPGQDASIKGVISLFDIETGDLLALLDSSLITSIRTGLSAAIATDFLANPQARVVAVVGAGQQNLRQLQYLLHFRNFNKIRIYDTDQSKSEEFRDTFIAKVDCEVKKSLSEAIYDADVILTATWSRKPVITRASVNQACHITSLGSDEKGKVELSKDLVQNSRFYCDDIELNMMMGTPFNLGLAEDCINGEIGELLSGNKIIERNEISIYSCVGLPFQDLIVAWHVYKKALEDESIMRVRLN